jgi:uncharacterized cupredoxin-like copper-binding protein
MQIVRLIAVAAVTAMVTACSGSSSSGPSAPTSEATVLPTTAPSSAPSQAATRIDVTPTDALTIEPAEMKVPAGVPVTFVVTNTGALDHELYLGDEAAQQAHATEMAALGGMTHDETEGIGVEPGKTKELTYTFPAAGATLAGCHVPGHYLAGMRAEITIE